MSKVEKLIQEKNEKYQHLENLDLFDAKDFIKQYESCKRDDKINAVKSKQEGLKRLRSVKELFKLKPISKGELFGLKKIVTKEGLTLEQRGMYDVFIENCMVNATYRVLLDCNHTKTDLSKFFSIGKEKFERNMIALKEADLIDYKLQGYNYEIYINPRWFRIGHYVSPKVVEMFNLYDEILVTKEIAESNG